MLESMKRGANPFQKFVSTYAKLFLAGKRLPPPALLKSSRKQISRNPPCALIFSPHPDDECIIGGLALRLLREADWKIVNVAVTLGSDRQRRSARLKELKNACRFLSFDLIVAGLEKVNLETRKRNSLLWKKFVRNIAAILMEQKPRVIFVPHETDVHAAHVGTHFLALDALKTLPKNFRCFVVETEFWGQIANPNLLVESGEKDVGDLVAALSLHGGEVRRNPYHVRLPAWMMDNVRRGAEQVGEKGGLAPDFTFGTLYQMRKRQNGKVREIGGRTFLSAEENTSKLFD